MFFLPSSPFSGQSVASFGSVSEHHLELPGYLSELSLWLQSQEGGSSVSPLDVLGEKSARVGVGVAWAVCTVPGDGLQKKGKVNHISVFSTWKP